MYRLPQLVTWILYKVCYEIVPPHPLISPASQSDPLSQLVNILKRAKAHFGVHTTAAFVEAQSNAFCLELQFEGGSGLIVNPPEEGLPAWLLQCGLVDRCIALTSDPTEDHLSAQNGFLLAICLMRRWSYHLV